MSDKMVKVLLLEDNPGDARLVKEMLSEADHTTFSVQWAETLVDGLERLSRTEFDAALIDLSLPDSKGLETYTALRRHAPRLPIVLLTGLDSDVLAFKAVESGAQDYLVKGKFTAEYLERAIRYAIVRYGKQTALMPEHKDGSLTGVLGSKGGVGVTVFSCHYAMELARRKRDSTLLVDLDSSSTGAAFLLKAHFQYSMGEASMNLNRLDGASWKGMVWTHAEGLDLAQAPGAIGLGDQLAPERVRHVLRFVRTLYNQLVVDLGRFSALTQNLLQEVDKLILLTTPGVPALFETKRLVQKLRDLGYDPSRVHVVLNRVHARVVLGRGELEKALGFPVFAELPNGEEDLDQSCAAGGSLPAGSALRKQIALVASRFEGAVEEPAPKRSGGFMRLLERAAEV